MLFWRVVAGLLAVLLIGVATIDMARRASAPERALAFEKGVYPGPREAPLDEATRERIRQRGYATSAW